MNPTKHIQSPSSVVGFTHKFYVFPLGIVAYLNKMVVLLLFIVNTSSAIFAQNNPPLVDTLTYCTGPMTPVILCNSYIDPDGDNVVVTGGHTTFNCSLVFLNDSCVRYTPLPGFMGTDIVFLDVCDDQNPAACSVSIVYVHVGCLPPIAYNDQALLSENAMTFNGVEQPSSSGSTVTFPVLQNDDPLCINNTLSVAVVLTPPANGSYAFTPNGTGLNYTPNPGFFGTDLITYVTCNNCPLCDTATVTIVVEPPPLPCEPDIYLCLSPNGSAELCPEFCDIDMNAINIYEYSAINGLISPPDGAGCFTYSALPGFSGEDLVAITACDASGECSTTFVFVVISNLCDDTPPIAVNDAQLVTVNTPVTIDVLANDSSPNTLPLSVATVTMPAHGTAVIAADGMSIQYIPNNGFTGNDTFSYSVCNTNGDCATALVVLEVTAACANEQQTCTQQGTPVQFCISFCSLEGLGNVSMSQVSASNNMSISQLSGNCLIYTPLPLFTGTDIVTIVGCTETGFCDTAYVMIEVGCFAPDANNDSVLSTANTSVSVNVSANDLGACSASSGNIVVSTPPANGLATVGSNGNITYTPTTDFSGTDMLSYTVCAVCNPSACSTAQVFFTITAQTTSDYDDYMAQPDVVQTPFGTPVTIPVLDNDLGIGLTILSYSLAANGIVVPNTDGTFTYIPIGSFTGPDYFFYQVCDGVGNCQQTIVAVTVLPSGNPALPPIAHNDMVQTALGQAVTIPVLTNDSDPQGTPLTITNHTNAANGSVLVNANGTITFTPNAGFSGNNTFTYTICNVQGLCATATVSVAVGSAAPSNLYPFAENDYAVAPIGAPVNISLLANDVEPNGQPLSATVLSNPMHGTVSLNPATGVAIYTPTSGYQGIDYFTYMACDAGLPVLCDTAYVAITIGSGNVPPIAQDDTAFGMENATVFILVILNDSDANDPLADLTITTLPLLPQNGTVTINGLQVIYQPNTGFTGTDQFTYTICDPAGACDEATVTVIINAMVQANVDAATTVENTPVNINVLTNDQGANIGISNVGTAANGTVVVLSGGIISYTPNNGFIGTDEFTYNICDNMGNCSQSIVTVTVTESTAPNLPPVAMNDVATTDENTSVLIEVLTNDTDPEGDAIAIVQVGNPSNGTVSASGTGILYQPNDGFTGTDEFTYTITDGFGNTATATVTITIVEEGNIVVAQNDMAETLVNQPVEIAILTNDVFNPDAGTPNITFSDMPPNGTVTVNDDLTLLYLPNLDFIGTDTFSYTLCVGGLCSTAIVTVIVNGEIDGEACVLQVASGFSPNGDGTNDTFMISGIDAACFQTVNIGLTIFNRWGDIMFLSSNYRNAAAWDGIWQKNGQEAQTGTYFYLIQYVNQQQKTVKMGGYVELSR